MQEAAVQEELRRLEFEAIYPTYTAERRKQQKFVKVERPIFGPYVFVRLDLADPGWKRIAPSRVRGVRRIISDDGVPVPIRSHEAAALLERCANGPMAEHEVIEYIKPDQLGRITSGIFEGMTGKCQWTRPHRRRAGMLLSVFGGKVQEVDIPMQWVQPIGESAA